MRYSHQRESIFHAVLDSYEHPTADMVYQTLRGENPKLSLGTVYRNLNQLADAGRLKKIPMPDGSCRFDRVVKSHSHIVCERCGQVADVLLPQLTELSESIERETAYTLSSYDVVMRGVCRKCHESGNTGIESN